ncbi:MAG: FAD-dependent oxidoreductase [Actinobacteria bacterium]|nr:FAD-dependent oxidoreductase [Actinomycetota bacterium]
MQLGYDVTVLEARDRVGGRVWSQELQPGRPDTVVERGAEFVLEGYTVMREIAQRFGLMAAPSGMSYYVRDPRNASTPITAEQVAAAARDLRPAAEGVPRETTLRAFLDEHGTNPAADEVLAARAAISWAASEDRLSAHVLLDSVASLQPLPTARMAGGNQGVAKALAAHLGDRVRLRSPVSSVRSEGAAVDVTVDGDVLHADRVVIAIPLPLLERLAIEPGLPDAQREAMARLVRGHAAKLHVPLAERPPTSAVIDVRHRFWTWTATDGSGEVQPIAHCFSGSPGALAGLMVTEGSSSWAEALRALRPDLDLMTDQALLSTWDDDPWATFAYSGPGAATRPGDEELIRAPLGRVHIAGEHTAGDWAGLMEGALRSGIRAADEVHAAV